MYLFKLQNIFPLVAHSSLFSHDTKTGPASWDVQFGQTYTNTSQKYEIHLFKVQNDHLMYIFKEAFHKVVEFNLDHR